MCAEVAPQRVVRTLHFLFKAFDELLDPLGVFKVDTVGASAPNSALAYQPKTKN